jgi:hypothetical protein
VEQSEGGCPVVATAQGLQITVSASDNLLLAAPAGAGIPVAQACVDYGVRDSSAFASSPYPGESVIAAPGLISNQTGQEMPAYPAYAASRYPAKERAEAEQPGYSLRSDSSEVSSQARARSAVGAEEDAGSTLATAKSTVDPATTASAATAQADTQPLTVNGVLRLGHVHSVASAKVDPEGKLHRSSDLRIGRTTVGGQEVVITPKGVKAAGQTVPVPETPPADALEEAGVTVRYLTSERTRSGVLSAGIEVTARQQDPESGAVTTVQYTLGRSFAAASPAVKEPGGPGGVPNVPVDPAGPASNGSVGGTGTADGPAPADAGDVPAEAPPAGGPPPPELAGPNQLLANPVDVGAAGFYLVLMLGALVMVASATLLRLLGVKTRWTS